MTKEYNISTNIISVISNLIVKLDDVIKTNEQLLVFFMRDQCMHDKLSYVIEKTKLARSVAYENLTDAYKFQKRTLYYTN